MTDQDDRRDDEILRAAARLPTAMRPQRDLWPQIAASINAPAPRRRQPWYAQAAAVLLLVGGTAFVTAYVVKGGSPVTQTTITSERLFEQTAFGSNNRLGPGFESAREALLMELGHELDKLAPQDRAQVRNNLAVIHDAIDEINTALEQDPHNALLQEKLLTAYQDQLTVLRRVSGLTRNVMLRNDI